MLVEALSKLERRRRWSQDDKARIVEETARGAKVTEVARRNGVAASLVFTWRRQARTSEQVAPSSAPGLNGRQAETNKRAIGAPEWHGSSVNAFVDSMVNGSINSLEPPYVIRIANTAGQSPEVLELIFAVMSAVESGRADQIRRTGEDAAVRIEVPD